MAMEIEKLLHWAFVLELPKARRDGLPGTAVASSSWQLVERVGLLGTRVDGCGASISDMIDAAPHPDALVIAEAVAALDDRVLVEGEEHDLLAGWPDLGVAGDKAGSRAWDLVSCVDKDGHRRLRSSLANLVRSVAILGRWPDWRCEEPTLVDEVGPNGKARWYRVVKRAVMWDGEGNEIGWDDVEIDGWDRRGRRPHPGAYRRRILVPDPAAALARRIEFELVHAALSDLAASLDGLGGRSLIGPTRSATPWAETRSEKSPDENPQNA